MSVLAAIGLAISEIQSKKKEADPHDGRKAPNITGTFVGRDVIGSNISTTIGETPELKKRRIEESLTVVRDELRWKIQRLASQITHTLINAPQGFTTPRRPGETRGQFEAHARNEFAREIEYFFAKYQQFSLSTQTYDAQRINISAFDDVKRIAVNEAYKAVEEAKNRVSLFRDYLQELLHASSSDTDYRTNRAALYKIETANELKILWFEILENWSLLEPDNADLIIVRGILGQVLDDERPPEQLHAGAEGRRYALQQRSRMYRKKTALVEEELRRRRETSPHKFRTLANDPPTSAADAVASAGIAFMEGSATDAVDFLRAALRYDDINDHQRHYIITSLAYLNDPDAFDGLLGAYLMDVDGDSKAAQAGLKKGDVILYCNGTALSEAWTLSSLSATSRKAPTVSVEIMRNGERLTKYIRGGANLGIIGTTLVHFQHFSL